MKLHLYKLKKPSIRTQIVVNMNKMIIFIYEAEKCGESNDGLMFLRMNVHNKLHIANCLAMDGAYPLFMYQFKESRLNIGDESKDMRFMYSAGEKKDSNLIINELRYKKVFGSFRSIIENELSMLGNKFESFNNNTAAVEVSGIRHYNLPFKMSCLLKKIYGS